MALLQTGARKSNRIVLLIVGALKKSFSSEKCILSAERINKYRQQTPLH